MRLLLSALLISSSMLMAAENSVRVSLFINSIDSAKWGDVYAEFRKIDRKSIGSDSIDFEAGASLCLSDKEQ